MKKLLLLSLLITSTAYSQKYEGNKVISRTSLMEVNITGGFGKSQHLSSHKNLNLRINTDVLRFIELFIETGQLHQKLFLCWEWDTTLELIF